MDGDEEVHSDDGSATPVQDEQEEARPGSPQSDEDDSGDEDRKSEAADSESDHKHHAGGNRSESDPDEDERSSPVKRRGSTSDLEEEKTRNASDSEEEDKRNRPKSDPDSDSGEEKHKLRTQKDSDDEGTRKGEWQAVANSDSEEEEGGRKERKESDEDEPKQKSISSDEDEKPKKQAVDSDEEDDEPRRKDISSDDDERLKKQTLDSDEEPKRNISSDDEAPKRKNISSDDEAPKRKINDSDEEGDDDDERPKKRALDSDDENDEAPKRKNLSSDDEAPKRRKLDSEDEDDKPVKRKKAVLSDSDEDEEKVETKKSRVVSDDEDSGSDDASGGPDKSLAAKLKELGSDSEEEEETKNDTGKKNEKALFGSDSDSGGDEEEKMIADIFGESGDEEGEEFTGFNQEELEAERPKPQDLSFMSDFDIMLARKKAQTGKRRRNRDGGTFISDADDVVSAMITKMTEAAEEDRTLNSQKKPALKKLMLLPTVVMHLKKQDLKETFIDSGVMTAIKDWISPLPDKSLPALKIREELLKILQELPSVSQETLKMSGIGRAVMFLYKHPKESRPNKDLALKLINEWSRPIFGLTSNYKGMTREERQQRDLDQQNAPRRRLSSGGQTPRRDLEKVLTGEEKALRPGDPGFCARARVPMPSNKDYVVRPKWNVEGESNRRSFKKGLSLLEKHKRRFVEERKQRRPQGAVKISIEGNRMPLYMCVVEILRLETAQVPVRGPSWLLGLSLHSYWIRLLMTQRFNGPTKKGLSRVDKQMRRFADIKRLTKPGHAVKISVEGNRMPL
ncbi:hypothetical protein DNTS_025723 [Danionella cerebrum]|uniref:TFIIS N-terminal domain-containing protein n=1 Tax=Danionella cerebrum TaxID=2873325 RepID=A0A553RD84_9TELE|nr:hypothetical protein DNTS_025723 [Danionella translucida]